MKLLSVDNFRLTGRNTAGGNAIIEYNSQRVKAEFNYYLQGSQCLGIRLGRHSQEIASAVLEEFIRKNLRELRKMVEPDIIRLKQDRLDKMMQSENL